MDGEHTAYRFFPQLFFTNYLCITYVFIIKIIFSYVYIIFHLQQHQQQQPPRFAPHVSTTSVMAHSNGISSSSGLTPNPSLNNNVFDSNHSGGGVNGHSEYIFQKKTPHFRRTKNAYFDIFKSIWLFQKRRKKIHSKKVKV